MDYLDHPFRVATGSSRRPTPLTYEHLRMWLDKDERFLELHSYTDITDINLQLDKTSKLMVSNIIHRVIAQIIGQRDPGFVTIKGTADGSIHVNLAESAATVNVIAALLSGSNTIGNVKIAGVSYTEKTAKIDITGASTHDITTVAPSLSYKISSIMFCVAGDVTVTLRDETAVLSGPMNFGGSGEPMGLAHNFGQTPLKCDSGKKFQITLDASIQVSGIITYYDS